MKTVRRTLRARRKQDERGLVLLYVAMLLTVLMVSSAFVVDIGAWTTRGQQIQRAADAAALAGVAYMPGNFAQAKQAALAVAAKNGFSASQVTVSTVADNAERLNVTITDTAVKRYFSQTFASGDLSMTRSAVAEFQPTVPLGSPENQFGLGLLGSDGQQTNQWAAITGWCTPKEAGDRFSAQFDGSLIGGTWTCPANRSAATNPPYVNDEYHGLGYSGYWYDVIVPAARKNSSASIIIEAYDAPFHPYWYVDASTTSDCSKVTSDKISIDLSYTQARNAYNMTSHFDVYDPSGTLVALNPFPSNEVGFLNAGGSHGDSTHCGWTTLATLPNSTPAGTYRVHVYTGPSATNPVEQGSFGVNAFALQARYSDQGISNMGRAPSNCSTLSQTWCTAIQPEDAMTAYAYSGSNVKGSNYFYLASVPASRKGATMIITLWDPGDGLASGQANAIKVLDPSNTSTAFTWSVDSTAHCGGTPACSGSASASAGLDTSGSTTDPPNTNLEGTSAFNDRLVTITVPIPNNYNPAANTGGWWKLQYTYNGSTDFHDLTTWTATVSGSPVHLVNG